MGAVTETKIYAVHDPLRMEDWRLRRTNQLVRKGRLRKDDDDWVRKYVKFRRDIDQPEQEDVDKAYNKAYFKNPGMVYAHKLFLAREQQPGAAFVIEARILARLSNQEIGKTAATIPETIQWYEKLFFNVRDRLNCHDWILTQVLTPALSGVPQAFAEHPLTPKHMRKDSHLAIPYYDSTLKYFAYFGGRVMCEFMLNGARIGVMPHSYDDLLGYMEDEFKHKFMRRTLMASQTFEMNKYNVTDMFATFAGIMALRAASDDAEKSKSGVHQSILGMLSDLPWVVGDSGTAQFAETPIAGYDNSAVELRADELLLVAGGDSDAHLKELQSLTIPEAIAKPKPTLADPPKQGS